MKKYIWKRATSEKFKNLNIILGKNEIGYETDTHLKKIGDGVTPWNQLQYFDRPKTIYEQAVDRGFKGTENDWNNIIHQKFIIAQANGFTGSELEWEKYLEPTSAYLEAVRLGYEGTPDQYYNGTISGISDSSWGTF